MRYLRAFLAICLMVVLFYCFFFIIHQQFRVSSGFALTFDDGPSSFTPMILDLLKEYNTSLKENNITVVFFVVGERAAEHPQMIKRIHEEGYLIGLHSWDHHFTLFDSPKKVQEDIDKTVQVIANITGERPTLYRAPWGVPSPFLPPNLEVWHWSKDTKDYAHLTAQDVFDELTKVREGDIVLLHDGGGKTRQHTVDALRMFLNATFSTS
ncbi:polysaccharide deacetylase family protein [Candidatus Woesearchaeota archaeon]|nr:MAG: polysaccharide deacetylase family protein [Candidatus Woesearchaeota archaeon]